MQVVNGVATFKICMQQSNDKERFNSYFSVHLILKVILHNKFSEFRFIDQNPSPTEST